MTIDDNGTPIEVAADDRTLPKSQSLLTVSGSARDIHAAMSSFSNPSGVVNHSRILCRGPYIQHRINRRRIAGFNINKWVWFEALAKADHISIES